MGGVAGALGKMRHPDKVGESGWKSRRRPGGGNGATRRAAGERPSGPDKGGTSVVGTKEKEDLQGWGTEGQKEPGDRRWRSRLGRSGGFSLQIHGRGKPHLPGERRKTKGKEDPDIPGKPQSHHPRPWPSCLSAKRKSLCPSCPSVASLGPHRRRLCGPELQGPEVRVWRNFRELLLRAADVETTEGLQGVAGLGLGARSCRPEGC